MCETIIEIAFGGMILCGSFVGVIMGCGIIWEAIFKCG